MERQYKGFLINLEGPEGSGKTTHIRPLVDHLRGLGCTIYPTREPGGTSIGEQIRSIIHSYNNSEMHPRTETLLYQSARAQIVEQVLIPKLTNGEIILLDRFYDSTLAYQGYGHQQDIGEIKQLINYATGGLTPDMTVLMDVDVEIGLSRKKDAGEMNRMDSLPIEFYQRVRQGYLELSKADPKRWLIVDANKSREEVYRELERVIDNRLIINGLIEGNRFRIER